MQKICISVQNMFICRQFIEMRDPFKIPKNQKWNKYQVLINQ